MSGDRRKPLTTCGVRPIIITGPPRWGEKHAWIVQDGPPYYTQLAGPFTARTEALDTLAEIVNDVAAADRDNAPLEPLLPWGMADDDLGE